MNEKEIWKPITGYEGKYEVSNLGRVKSLSRIINQKNGRHRRIKERILIPGRMGNYHGVVLCNDDGMKKCYIHRLVCAAFIGDPIGERNVTNHKDGDKFNNRVSNLEWVTYAENLNHAYQYGLQHGYGENSHYSKFSDEVVKKVREQYATGKYLQVELAEMHGISKMQIHRIVKYKNRKRYGRTMEHGRKKELN